MVNGRTHQVPDRETVAGLILSLDVSPDAAGIAVAVDGEVVPRRTWAQAQLRDGAQVEIVVAVQGG